MTEQPQPRDTKQTTHELETLPTHFQAVWRREKRAEMRSTTNRMFRVGDDVRLVEFDPESESLTGRAIVAEITHILHGPGYGIAAGYAMLSFDIKEMTNARNR